MKLRIALLVAGATGFAVGMPPLSALERAPYSGIVVFGTSLSDSGNAFALRGGANTPPDYLLDPLLIPSAPYARGGHHFSNGATWIEQFAESIGLAGSVRPAFASLSPKGTNYAVGAARAYEDGINVNLSYQVNAFLADVGSAAPSDALYVIEMGGNDLRDAVVAFQTGGTGAALAILQQAVDSISVNIQRLHDAGAREFLVWIPPNIALTPALRSLAQVNPMVTQLATFLTFAFNSGPMGNTGLIGALTTLSQLDDINITLLDAYTLLNNIRANPAGYGLSDATTACVTPNVAPFSCQQPDEYLFWDGIHPTRAAHDIVAQEAARVLAQ